MLSASRITLVYEDNLSNAASDFFRPVFLNKTRGMALRITITIMAIRVNPFSLRNPETKAAAIKIQTIKF